MASNSNTSGGNEGSRGSRGIPNTGAQADDGTHRQGDGPAATGGRPDLRREDARGGGGAGSGSSRSADQDSFDTPKE